MFIVLFALFFIMCVFLGFDRTIAGRQRNFVEAAKASDEIVRSLFPEHMADRLYESNKAKKEAKANTKNGKGMVVTTRKSLLTSYMQSDNAFSTDEPLADVYPSATVIFAGT